MLQTVAGLVIAVATMVIMAPMAQAARPATASENAAIKRVALKSCTAPGGCRWRGALVSTRDPRFAWGRVIGEGVSGVLVRRASRHGGRFRVLHVQGGGIEKCSMWRKHAPRPVLRDLRIHGLVGSGATVTCG
jgi:hypothetical protein